MDNRVMNNRDEVKFLRELFTDSPHLSVDQAAKECSRFHFPIHKGIISQVRRAVREGMLTQAGKPILPIVPEPIAPPAPQVVNQRQVGLEEEMLDSRTPQRIKEDYVDDMILEDPSRTTTTIQKMVVAKFGSGIAPPFLTSRLAIARALAGLPIITKKLRAKKEETPVQPVLPQPKMEEPKMAEKQKVYAFSWFDPNGIRAMDKVTPTEMESVYLRIKAQDGRDIELWVKEEFVVEVKVKFGR